MPTRVRRLISVTVVTDDPVRSAIGYLPLFGPDRVQVSDAMTVVDTGAGVIRFVTPKGLRMLYDALLPLPEHDTPWVAAMRSRSRQEPLPRFPEGPPRARGEDRQGLSGAPGSRQRCIIEFVQL